MLTWLRKEPRGWRKILLLAGLILLIDYCLALLALLYFGRSPPSIAIYAIRALKHTSNASYVLGNLLVWVTFEVVLFQALPIALVLHLRRGRIVFGGADRATILISLGVAVASSFAFGFLAPQHALLSFQNKCWTVVGGMLLSLLYIKCGGLRREISVKALLFCIYAHFLADALYLGMFAYLAHRPR